MYYKDEYYGDKQAEQPKPVEQPKPKTYETIKVRTADFEPFKELAQQLGHSQIELFHRMYVEYAANHPATN